MPGRVQDGYAVLQPAHEAVLSAGVTGTAFPKDQAVDKAAVKRDKYVVLLQVKYGYTRQHAREEISKRVAEYEARRKSNAPVP